MHIRQPYIKPSLLRLEFTTNVADCDFGNCKTSTSSSGQCDGGAASCQTSACNAVGS
jgi:hypothetical protein